MNKILLDNIDNLVKIIIAVIAIFSAGFVIKKAMYKNIKQSSNGEKSPNIIGNNNKIDV